MVVTLFNFAGLPAGQFVEVGALVLERLQSNPAIAPKLAATPFFILYS
jgi:hypothetical protein